MFQGPGRELRREEQARCKTVGRRGRCSDPESLLYVYTFQIKLLRPNERPIGISEIKELQLPKLNRGRLTLNVVFKFLTSYAQIMSSGIEQRKIHQHVKTG